MSRPFSYSYSLISAFESCAYRMYREKIVKDIPFVQNEAARFGSAGHDAMDKAIKTNSLPTGEFEFLAPTLQSVYKHANGAKIHSEYGLGLTEDLQPTTFRAGYLKGKLDAYYKTSPELGWNLDWKLAKRSGGGGPDRYALEADVFNYLTFKNDPEVQEIRTAMIWLKEEDKGDPTKYRRTRADIPELEDRILGKIAKIEESLQFDDWKCKPSGLCGYCPVKDCKFYRAPKK